MIALRISPFFFSFFLCRLDEPNEKCQNLGTPVRMLINSPANSFHVGWVAYGERVVKSRLPSEGRARAAIFSADLLCPYSSPSLLRSPSGALMQN
jgi:hypothetical protein